MAMRTTALVSVQSPNTHGGCRAEDLGECESFFSKSNPLAFSTRYATAFHIAAYMKHINVLNSYQSLRGSYIFLPSPWHPALCKALMTLGMDKAGLRRARYATCRAPRYETRKLLVKAPPVRLRVLENALEHTIPLQALLRSRTSTCSVISVLEAARP
ncbi:hypothetical protein C8R47DRAFT_1212745 [Mycena vitilis]|nr:hypothetical protein C8R47DRAFT_1212745 [Mycena vitilis]